MAIALRAPWAVHPGLEPPHLVLRVKALPVAQLGLMVNSNQGGVVRGACLAVLVRPRGRLGGRCFAPVFSALVLGTKTKRGGTISTGNGFSIVKLS